MDHPNDPHNIFEMIQRIKCKYKTLVIKEIRKGMHKAGSEPGEKKAGQNFGNFEYLYSMKQRI